MGNHYLIPGPDFWNDRRKPAKTGQEFSEKENRSLAQSPMLSVEDYFSGAFAKDYEAYITDQFILRDEWIGMKTKVERAVGKQEINDIYFAKDNYLIEKHTGSFTTDTAKRNISSLAQFMQFCEEKYGEGHVTAMVVPNAVKVLEDKLPPFAPPLMRRRIWGRFEMLCPGEPGLTACLCWKNTARKSFITGRTITENPGCLLCLRGMGKECGTYTTRCHGISGGDRDGGLSGNH